LLEKEQKIDYSSVKILLYNKNGLLKDTTQCSPTGYFVLPFYDNGNYKIKISGPEGWFFGKLKINNKNRQK
jgi:hypothetical protein